MVFWMHVETKTECGNATVVPSADAPGRGPPRMKGVTLKQAKKEEKKNKKKKEEEEKLTMLPKAEFKNPTRQLVNAHTALQSVKAEFCNRAHDNTIKRNVLSKRKIS